MRRAALCLLIAAVACGVGLAQSSGTAPAIQQSRIVGVVTQLQSGGFTLHGDAGPDLAIRLADAAVVLRVPPGATNLNSAAKISISDVSVGDRVLVRGRLSEDQKSVVALSVMVMTKADLASAQEAERLDWQRRGIAGTATAVNVEKREITIDVPAEDSPGGNRARSQTITLAADNIPQRYAPDSVKFSEVMPSALEQIRVGDQVRALGTKIQDGSFRAEKLVFGTFRNFGVTVLSVNTQDHTITVKDMASGHTILVRTKPDSALHRLPPDVARMWAKPNAVSGTDSEQLIERVPLLSVGEIKSGEPLIVLSTEGAQPSEVTAILVLAGVEPILAARPKGSEQVVIGPWSLGKGNGEDAP